MERIGGYLVERKLGEGGMGTVFLARTRGGRAVALKVAKAELAADPVFRERFRSEVEAARTVGGFHTAPVVDADVDGDPLWLATAYIPGPTLAARLAAQGAMDEQQLRSLAAALAEALESIHSRGLVHRDLKPGNIIMAEDGPRVLDFGIARAVESTRLTATGTAFGTPGFLAPEQALGNDVTGAADVFALGAVLVAAAGGSAWGEGTPMGLMYRSVHEPPNVSAVPAALVDLVSACLAKDPADRPTPTGLLDRLTGEPPDRTPPAATPYTPTVAAPATPPHARAAPPASSWTPPHQAATPARPAMSPHLPPQPATPPQVPYGFGPPLPYGAPEVEFTDRDSRVVVNATGVVLEVAGAAADFEWAEIAGVVRTPSPRGSRLTVTVRLWDGGVYSCELNARRSARLTEWIAHLDHVLGRYLAGR
ncbi:MULTISPECIES: protein kinase domain-containing protein [unclassified Streptomyces]|uniref:protein kinase domain-containing protein n=1 Tax=unclassified Streptomyces TaxID=2593676 RepID=UPI00300B7224